jgi:hypothetical protein
MVEQAQEKSKTEDFPHEDEFCNSTQRSAGGFDRFPGSGVGVQQQTCRTDPAGTAGSDTGGAASAPSCTRRPTDWQ